MPPTTTRTPTRCTSAKTMRQLYTATGGERIKWYALAYKQQSLFLLQWLTYILILLTAGLLRVVLHWLPEWHLFLMAEKCALRRATVILVSCVT